MQSNRDPAGGELSEGESRVAFQIILEVNLSSALLSSDTGSLCLHINQNSVISMAPRWYVPDGDEGRREASLAEEPTTLRGQPTRNETWAYQDLCDPLHFDYCQYSTKKVYLSLPLKKEYLFRKSGGDCNYRRDGECFKGYPASKVT